MITDAKPRYRTNMKRQKIQYNIDLLKVGHLVQRLGTDYI